MLTPTRWIKPACVSITLLVCVTGCFRRGPELAPVTGTVTLDGEPLANAQVEFKPMRGNPSYGTTDSLGRYELEFTKDKVGAVVGTHVVRITTQTTIVDPDGNEVQVPQRVPEKYNERSELIRKVEPEENRLDFALKSEPEPEEPEPEEAEAKKPDAEEGEAEEPGVEQPETERREAEEPDKPAPPMEEPGANEPESPAPDTLGPGPQEPGAP